MQDDQYIAMNGKNTLEERKEGSSLKCQTIRFRFAKWHTANRTARMSPTTQDGMEVEHSGLVSHY